MGLNCPVSIELIDAGIEPAGAKLPVAKKTAAQWCLQVYWWLSLGFVVLMAVDVLRKKPKKYGLWLLLTTAFVGVMYSYAQKAAEERGYGRASRNRFCSVGGAACAGGQHGRRNIIKGRLSSPFGSSAVLFACLRFSVPRRGRREPVCPGRRGRRSRGRSGRWRWPCGRTFPRSCSPVPLHPPGSRHG